MLIILKKKKVGFKYKLKSKIQNKKISILKKNSRGIVAVGCLKKRRKIVKQIYKINPSFKWEKIISKNSNLSKLTKIGDGTVVISGSTINADVNIGEHCIINTACSIDHDCKIGNFVNISPGSVLAGNVTINDNVLIGLNSTIRENIFIAKNISIGCNSFVNKKITSPGTYVGSPVKKLNSIF